MSVTVTGVREAQDAIRRLGLSVERETGPILLSGATVMRGAIRGEAAFSSETGAMQRAIISKLIPDPRAKLPLALAAIDLKLLTKRSKTTGKIVPYPYFVQAGVSPHEIKARDGGALHYKGTTVARVKHPGFAARPFFSRGVARGRYSTKKHIEQRLVDLMRRLGADDAGV